MISKNAENTIKTCLKSKISVAPELSDGRFYWFRISFISKIEKLKIANWRSEFPPQLATQYVKMSNAKKCWNTYGFSIISYVNGATVPMLYVVFISFALVFIGFGAHHKIKLGAAFGLHWKLAKWMISKNAENIIKTCLKSKISVAPKLSDGRFYGFCICFYKLLRSP